MNRRVYCSTFAFIAVLTWTGWAAPITKEKEPPGTPPKKADAVRSANNLKILALGWHNYESAHGTFPGNLMSKAKEPKPLLSWRVAILPYLEEDVLNKQFKLDEPWDSEHNKKLIDKIPIIFQPVRGKAKLGETYYQGFAGINASLPPGTPIRIADVTDGTSNTLMLAEADKAVIWSKPDDIPFDGKLDGTERPGVGGLFGGHFHVAFCDGSVRFMSNKVNTKTLRMLITTSGGEVFDANDIPKSNLFSDE